MDNESWDHLKKRGVLMTIKEFKVHLLLGAEYSSKTGRPYLTNIHQTVHYHTFISSFDRTIDRIDTLAKRRNEITHVLWVPKEKENV